MKLAIFDLDGTLLNTIADLGEACNYALSQCGYPTHQKAEYPNLVGNGVNKLIERALPEGEKTEQNILRVRQHFTPYYDQHNTVYTQPYEGIITVLEALRKAGYKLAVASNKYQSAAQQVVEHYFHGIFDTVHGEREGVARKPSPEVVQNIMSQFEDITLAYYIGDSDVDMQTAINYNALNGTKLNIVACTWGFCPKDKLSQYHSDYIIDSATELINICL